MRSEQFKSVSDRDYDDIRSNQEQEEKNRMSRGASLL